MVTSFIYNGVDGDMAILSDESGREIRFPQDKIPADVNIGAPLSFSIFAAKDLVKSNKDLAKEILNEILHISE